MFMLWPSDPTDLALPAGREQADGETVGWVSKVEANTIHVNSGPFGGGVMPLVVTKETRITIGTKEAWFEDIRPGGQVKVAYELYRGRRLARTVELLVDQGPRRPARPEARVKNAVSSGLLDRAPAKASATAGPGPQTRPAPDAGAAGPAAESAAKGSGLARPAAPARPEVRVAPRPEAGHPAAPETSVPPRTGNTAARSAGSGQDGPRVPETTRPASAVQASPPPATRPAEGELRVSVQDDQSLLVEGEQVFDIRDFNVNPPRILMLRVYPDVRVRLQLVAERVGS
jgi:hypothetical protein